MFCTQHRFADLANPLRGVRKIQNARGTRRMKIDEALYPFRSITYARNLPSRLETSAIQFAEREALKQLGFRLAREVRMGMRRHDRFSSNDAGRAHFAYHQGFDFRPFAVQHG